MKRYSWVVYAALTPIFTVITTQTAAAAGPTDNTTGNQGTPSGARHGKQLAAGVGTKVQVKRESGANSGKRSKAVTPVDPNWKPPACWYEPAMNPKQLKSTVEQADKAAEKPRQEAPGPVQKDPSMGRVGATDYWTAQQMVDHYKDGKAAKNYDAKGRTSTASGYKNFNLGKSGMFWRGVINPKSS